MIIPFSLKKGSTVLISGCGGGFDIVAGIPLALELEKMGHKIIFSSYSFTRLNEVENALTFPNGIKLVDANSTLQRLKFENNVYFTEDESIPVDEYFPEKYMCEWYKNQGKPKKIFCYNDISIHKLTRFFNALNKKYKIDCHIVMDGGADGILRGDEFELGSPLLDTVSIMASDLCTIENKIYALSAFGSEGVNNDVSHAEVLKRMSEITATGHMLGISSILNNSEIADSFKSAVDHIMNRTHSFYNSVIISSIVESLKGKYGYQSFNTKTNNSPVWISPLQSLLWYMDLHSVAQNKVLYSEFCDIKNDGCTNEIIWSHWGQHRKKERESIPI